MRTTQTKSKKPPKKRKKVTIKTSKPDPTPHHERPWKNPKEKLKLVHCTHEQDERWERAFYHGPEQSIDEWMCKALDIAADNPPVYRLSSKFSAALKRLAYQYEIDMYEIADRLMYRAIREADNRIAHRIDPFEPQLIDDFDCTDSADRMCLADMSRWERDKGMRFQEYLLTQHTPHA